MSDVGIGRTGGDTAFRPLTVALLLAVGILGFVGSLLLGAFAPDFRSGRNGGSHALSNAATGYAGLVELARATGRHPRIIRDAAGWQTEDLVVLTPESGATDMTAVLAARGARATLVVLPKWATVADRDTRGWVNLIALLPASEPAGVLAPATMLAVTRHRSGGRPLHTVAWAPGALKVDAPRALQTIAAPRLTPLVTDDAGHIVLGRIGDSSRYILADPDLLSNHGIATATRARAALALLDFVNATGAEGVAFDVTLNGFGRTRTPLRLAFEPPFLAMTIALAVALLLVGWQALARFGAPRPRVRALAFGKVALIDNTAALVAKAGREAAIGARYAGVVRERARTIFGVPAALGDAQADAYLDGLRGGQRFTALVAEAERADSAREALWAAQALHRWQWEKTR